MNKTIKLRANGGKIKHPRSTTWQGNKVYKVVTIEGGPNIQRNGFKYRLPPNAKTPGGWHSVKGTLRVCRRGLHITTDPVQWHRSPTDRVFEVEFRGKVAYESAHHDKIACASIRLLREVVMEVTRHGSKRVRPFAGKERSEYMKRLKLNNTHTALMTGRSREIRKLEQKYGWYDLKYTEKGQKAYERVIEKYARLAKKKGISKWPHRPIVALTIKAGKNGKAKR